VCDSAGFVIAMVSFSPQHDGPEILRDILDGMVGGLMDEQKVHEGGGFVISRVLRVASPPNSFCPPNRISTPSLPRPKYKL
jgi:hypothetical protein